MNSYLDYLFGMRYKTVVITGGGGAIAEALAFGFLKAGANVALWDIDLEAVNKAVKILGKDSKPGQIFPVEMDASEKKSIEEAIKKTSVFFDSSIDILVNAAGGGRGKFSFLKTDMDLFDFVIKLNLYAGLVIPSQVLIEYWIKNHINGSIINLASMCSFIPQSGVYAYNAAKAAVKNITEALAKEFAPQGIRVNAIAPGWFVGKQNYKLLFNEDETLTDRAKAAIAHTPMDRFGEVKELIGAALLLANNGAGSFITGITIPVDGGYLVQNV